MVSEAWLEAYVPDLPPENREALVEWRARKMAHWVTHAIVETAVERKVYEDPNNWAAVARFCTEVEDGYGISAGAAPQTETGVAYCQALHTPLIWHYPGYIQNYILSYVTEARLYDSLVAGVGEPVDNMNVGPWLMEHVTQGGAITPFEQRLAAVSKDEKRTSALERYVQIPAAPESTETEPTP